MARARNSDEKSLVLAGIARAFCELEETKRKLKMRPLPKSIDVSKTTKRRNDARDSTAGLELREL